MSKEEVVQLLETLLARVTQDIEETEERVK